MGADLGAVLQNSNSHVDLEMPTDATDVNHCMYEEALNNINNRKSLESLSFTGRMTPQRRSSRRIITRMCTWTSCSGECFPMYTYTHSQRSHARNRRRIVRRVYYYLLQSSVAEIP